MKKEKQLIVDRSLFVSIDDLLDGKSLTEVIDTLKMEQWKAENYEDAGFCIEDIRFRIEYFGHDGGIDVYMDFYRKETDAELSRRLKVAEKVRKQKQEQKKKKENKEREQYEKLKKKYGSN